jgi:hypothetical protein
MDIGIGGSDSELTGSASSAAVTINARAANLGPIILGCGVSGGIGVISVVSVFTGNVSGGTGASVAAFIIGSIFTFIGMLPLLMWRIVFRPRHLILEPEEIKWDDPRGKPWRVAWHELSGVELSIGGTRGHGVTIVLMPADIERFQQRHPDMAHLLRGSSPALGYRLPLGPAKRIVAPIDRALRSFARDLYDSKLPELSQAPAPSDAPAARDMPAAPRRPRALQVSVMLVAAYWVGAISYMAWNTSSWEAGQLAAAAFWTLVVAAWLWRVWAGGTMAIGRLRWLATALGAITLAGVIMISFLLRDFPSSSAGAPVLAALPGVAMAAALLVTGRLLARDDVRAWAHARTLGA